MRHIWVVWPQFAASMQYFDTIHVCRSVGMRLADTEEAPPDALWPGLLSGLGNCGGKSSLWGGINMLMEYSDLSFIRQI